MSYGEVYLEIQEAGVRLLVDAGIDPKVVALDGITLEGYDEFQFDENGRGIFEDGNMKRVRRAWPAGFNAARMVAIARMLGGE